MISLPRFSTLAMPTVFGLALILSLVRVTATASHEYFIEKPHLVATNEARVAAVTWLSPDSDANWVVRYRATPSSTWQQAPANLVRRVPGEEMRTRRLYEAVLEHMSPGQSCEFEVLRNGTKTFGASGTASAPEASAIRTTGL
jgi:hypothetical protein